MHSMKQEALNFICAIEGLLLLEVWNFSDLNFLRFYDVSPYAFVNNQLQVN